MKLVPNTPANIFTLSAIIIGYILIDEATPAEQNSLGNWFMLIGQVLSTNSAQQQVLNNRNGTSNKENEHIINDTIGSDTITQEQIKMLEKIKKAIDEHINSLKK